MGLYSAPIPSKPTAGMLLQGDADDLRCLLLGLRETLWWIALQADQGAKTEMARTAEYAVEQCLGRISMLEERLKPVNHPPVR